MTKYFISLVALTAMFLNGSPSRGAVRKINCNFSQGIPDDFTLIDADGNTLSRDVQKFGFAQGDSWVPFYIQEEDNAVASSTSWYSPAGTSSDWMLLPPLQVEPGATLSWRAKATDKRFRDGYAVYAAAASASSPQDFLDSDPLFTVEAEESDWVTHSLSLERFAGSEVRLAFVNNSTNCSRLFIDDISAGIPSPLNLELTMPYLIPHGKNIHVTGWLLNRSQEPIKGYTLSLESEDGTVEQHFDSEIAPGNRMRLEWLPRISPSGEENNNSACP